MGIVSRRAGLWVAWLAVAAIVQAGVPGSAAEYVVDGFELGRPIPPGDANYASYDCKTSADYDGAVMCSKSESKKGQAGRLLVSSTLVHAEDGPTWLESVHVAPVKLSQRALEKEIKDLTRVIGAEPRTVDWEPGYTPELKAVIATWGDVELEEVYFPVPEDIGRAGGYIDLIGDPAVSLEKFLPVYRVKGGAGYIYAANFNASGIGDRYYVAVNAAELAPSSYRTNLRTLLAKDKTLGADDYSLWPDVAMATRMLSLATSSSLANEQFDTVANDFPDSKLRSHVWASLPSGAISRLQQGSYWIDYDVYGPKTQYPVIRKELQDLIANEPDDNFVEFAHLFLGDFEGGMQSNPKSIITGVFHYALGIESLRSLFKDALVALRNNPPDDLTEDDLRSLEFMTTENPDWGFSLGSAVAFVTRSPGVAPGELSRVLPDFETRAQEVRAHLAQITDDMSVADDAAFMAALLDLQTGDLDGALAFASQGLGIAQAHLDFDGTGRNDDWLDYHGAARAQARRIVDRMPREEVIPKLQADKVLSKEGFLWYGTAREAYRAFDYGYAIELAEAGLSSLGLPSDQLPATTDPNKIRDAIERIAPELLADLNIVELPYLLEASREIASYEDALAAEADATDVEAFSARARLLASKYSMLISSPDAPEGDASSGPPRHQDLRQALHIIDTTLEQTAHNPAYAPLREWLSFRKVRVLTVYDSDRVRSAVAQLAEDFPMSQYLDDALAEQVFVEGMRNSDMQAAWQALDELVRRAPEGSNAIDNAYSWMEISLKCHGLDQAAAEINSEIIRLFPFSRHAQYAVGRASDPDRYPRGCAGGYLD